MKVSYNWLKTYVETSKSPQEIADIITLSGLEVEEINQIGSKLNGVVLGKVLTCQKHPNADRLTVCSVDVGSAVYPVVCGAPNVAAGQYVAFATVGTVLPITDKNGDDLIIKKSHIRGEVSEGMICAEDELGLGSDHSGILILNTQKKLGTPIQEVLDIQEDYQFEIAITPNRPDATCHIGVARDISAVLNIPLKKPVINPELNSTSREINKYISVSIHNPEKCNRYVGVLIQDVTINPSPKWLQDRLVSIGLRPVNNVVDISNFVLHEMGQPLHTFDYDTISDKKIIVKDFDQNIMFRTLDEIERNVPAGSLFICDGNGPVAIAGIMGGLHSGISSSTRTIFIESAYFEPTGIRKTSKSLALQTDSSYRFERGIDPEITRTAALRCADLIVQLAGGIIVDGIIDVHPVRTEPQKVELTVHYVNSLLGTNFNLNQISSTLKSLEIEVKKQNAETLACTIPTFRPDITQPVDLVEEVARIFDYNKIPNPEKIQFSRPSGLPLREVVLNKIMISLRSLGLNEIYTNSLIPEPSALAFFPESELIHTLNPISQDTTTLRPSLKPGFIKAASFNFNRIAASVRFFEIGNIFKKSGTSTYHDGVFEETSLLIGIGGLKHPQHWAQKETSFSITDLKSLVNGFFSQLGVSDKISYAKKSNSSLTVSLAGLNIGVLEIIDASIRLPYNVTQDLFVAELSIDTIVKHIDKHGTNTYTPVPKFPGIEFDLALVVNKDTDAGELELAIKFSSGKLLKKISVFDVFEGGTLPDNTKSIAFRLFFLDSTKTLTIRDVDAIISKVLKTLEKQFNAKLRT